MKSYGLICTSVFRNGKSTPTADQITKVWINLINRLEKSKEIIAAAR